ncbi:MAG TPA: ABC transporter permease [Chryseosolibacter sp.]
MLKNYFKTAVRNLRRHRFFSAINIFGLAVAMSVCMAMIMLVADQMSYDRYNTNANRIYRITTIDVDENGNIRKGNKYNSASSMPLAAELKEKYTSVEDAVHLRRGFGNGWLELEGQDLNIPLSGFFADENVLAFFQYELEYGDAQTALRDPFTVVLTRKAANKLFKDDNPVGQTLKVGDQGLYTVTGVLKETNRKSHIVFEGLASMATLKSLEQSGKISASSADWSDYWQGWTYILSRDVSSSDQLQHDLDKIYNEHIAPMKQGVHKMRFGLQPLLRITPGAIMNNSIGPQLPWEFVYFLGGLALVILITSCFNFTNLSIARSLTRAREIGVRKVAGAARMQIFAQFMVESVVVAFSALVIAVLLLVVLKPMILDLSFSKAFRWDLNEGAVVYLVFIVFALAVGVMAGLFPAVVLSGFQPIKVLKNLSNVKLFSRMGMRKALLVSQFTLSLFFIVTVIVIYKQLDLFTHQEHGFNVKNNIMIRLGRTPHQTLKTELQKYNNITAVAAASHVPAAGTSHGTSIQRQIENASHVNANIFYVDEDYEANMHLNVLAGEFFDAEKKTTASGFVVINAAAVSTLNFGSPQEAVGETVMFVNDSTSKTILGVVANYNHRDLTRQITPLVLLYKPEAFSVMQVAYVGPYEKAVESIERAWAVVNPGMKVDHAPVESEINKFYEFVFGDLVKVLGFISFLAIVISCLGLLGMATYATETRVKEISIRKILGSSSGSLVLLLSGGFIKILFISIMIGAPLAWFVNTLWLEQIAYHTTVGPAVIGLSIFVLSIFAVLTIGSQTVRATFVNPVDNLKNE